MWHRQNWNVVYPQLSLDHKGEMEELAKHGTYVAGFLDPSVQGKTDLYDLFVNGEHPLTHLKWTFHATPSNFPFPVPAASLTVAPHAKGTEYTFTHVYLIV